MSIVSPRTGLIAAVWLLGALPCGCKRGAAPTPGPSVSQRPSALPLGSALPMPEPVSHCRRLSGPTLTLEPDAPVPAHKAGAEEEEDEALLPFGVDLGSAVPLRSGFAVVGIRGQGQAFVALLGEPAPRRVDLGELHGEVQPPALVARAEEAIVALRSSDAAGYTIKLGKVRAAGGVEWGHELSKLGKLVSSVGIALSGSRGVLAFQSEGKQGELRVLLGSFSADDIKQPFEARPLELKDISEPRLSTRPGGYWLTWVRSLPEAKTAAKPKPDAGSEDPEERELLELGLRVVEVAKLDEQGQLQGEAKRLGVPRRQELLFDIAPLESGGLLVATRSDSASPGVEGGALTLSTVQPDGSVQEERLEDDEIGAGVPALLVDPRAPATPWLSVSSPSDATRLGLVRGARTYLQGDPLLVRADVIAVKAGHFLTQRARGRGVELATLDCQWPPEPPAEKK
ncbi:MAG TPA: hypothetical protein VJN18_21570 [Polyangiaceae bacterium]|nr:hypothetical protein [Polyangiaceae bacterium]